MPRSIKLFLLSIRDLIASAGPSLVLVFGLLVGRLVVARPAATEARDARRPAPTGSAYAGFGSAMRWPSGPRASRSSSSPDRRLADNLALLRGGEADVAFVRGGSADPVADEEAGLLSLGSLFFEPLWVFYRTDAARRDRPQDGHADIARAVARLCASTSTSPAAACPRSWRGCSSANHMDPATLQLSNLEQAPAAAALQAGLLDAIVLASAPQSPLVQRLLRAPDIRLMDFGQSDAYCGASRSCQR